MRSAEPLAVSLLRKGLDQLSLGYTSAQVTAFMTYLSELKKWSKAYNLTSLRTDEDIVIKHFLDSLLYLGALPEGEISVMDVGSGAGFPGIPMKIMRPEIEIYLLEPSRKKAAFLTHIIGALGLDRVHVIEKRIEDMEQLAVDVAVTRALFDIKEFIRKASPHVIEGGRLVLSKGPRVNEELKAINDVRYEVLTLSLPVVNMRRFIVTVYQSNPDGSIRRNRSGSGSVCVNAECRLRKAGCKGFEGCPGFKSGT